MNDSRHNPPPQPDPLIEHRAEVGPECRGQRLDQVAAQLFPDYSRARLQSWIKAGQLRVDGAIAKPKDKLLGGEQLHLLAELEPAGDWQPQAIRLDIHYEDEHLLVLNKPAGLVVHPAAGNPDGTLVNALLHHAESLAALPRAGIVHRLDKDTTGLMVVAKTLTAHAELVAQLQARTVQRQYEAVVQGQMSGGGTVEAAIGRHPRDRKKMAVVSHGGKPAVTHYRLITRFSHHSHIRCQLETGRTHQIRVHMQHRGYPLVGDPVYGGRLKLPAGVSEHLRDTLRHFPRQALHAAALALVHPATGETVRWESPLPADMQDLLAQLAAECPAHA